MIRDVKYTFGALNDILHTHTHTVIRKSDRWNANFYNNLGYNDYFESITFEIILSNVLICAMWNLSS